MLKHLGLQCIDLRTILGTFFFSFNAGFWKPDSPTQFHEKAPAAGAMLPCCHVAVFVLIDNLPGKLCFCGSFSGLKYFKSSTDCYSYLTSWYGEFQLLDTRLLCFSIYFHNFADFSHFGIVHSDVMISSQIFTLMYLNLLLMFLHALGSRFWFLDSFDSIMAMIQITYFGTSFFKSWPRFDP